MKPEKYQELHKKLTDSHKKLQESIAAVASDCEDDDKMKAIYGEMEYMFRYLMGELDYVASTMFEFKQEHMKGHLPAISSPSAMENALAALGIGGDYEVSRPSISVAKTRNGGVQFTATYKK